MESPIDPRSWKFLFHAGAAAFTTSVLWSLWLQRRHDLASLSEPLSALRKALRSNAQEAVGGALQDILEVLQEEQRSKKGGARLALFKDSDLLLKAIKLSDDGSNADTAEVALRIVGRVFCSDADGRYRLYRSGGYRVLISTLGKAYQQGHRRLMEAAAATLHAATEVDDDEVILDNDVPHGAEGIANLAAYNSTVNMLRLLDPNAPIVFLNSLTGIFANVCCLRVGSLAVGKGIDGKTGVSFFLNLLDHGNQGIVEHCAVAIRFLARNKVGHAELAQEDAVRRLARIFDANKDPRITNAVLTVILIMSHSKDHRKQFLETVANKSDIIQTLFIVWCRGAEKSTRDRADWLVHALERTPECAVAVRHGFERNRSNIQERKTKDEEARRKQMQQAKQQQMMQQMMMMQEMGGMEGMME